MMSTPRTCRPTPAQQSAFALHEQSVSAVYDWHQHDVHQLLYAPQGVIHLETRRQRFLLPPQRAAWLPAGVEHRTSVENSESISLFFPPECLWQDHLPLLRDGRLRIVAAPALMREMMLYACRWPREESDPLQDSTVGCASADLLRPLYFHTVLSLCNTWVEHELPFVLPIGSSAAIRRAQDYAQAHLSTATCAQAAQQAALSERSLRRHFVAETGMTWQDYLHHSRLLRATARLAAEDIPLEVLAEDVGFSSLSAFSRAFSRLNGVTPGRYRQSLRLSSVAS